MLRGFLMAATWCVLLFDICTAVFYLSSVTCEGWSVSINVNICICAHALERVSLWMLLFVYNCAFLLVQSAWHVCLPARMPTFVCLYLHFKESGWMSYSSAVVWCVFDRAVQQTQWWPLTILTHVEQFQESKEVHISGFQHFYTDLYPETQICEYV